jgi:ribulose-phosphate 3-epimerase
MCNLEDQVRQLEKNGIGMLHVDILDGYFSPSMPLGFEVVKQLRAKTNLFFDCHVMVNDPEYFINELLDIGVQHITFHIETCSHIDGMLNKIHSAGVLAGVALKPATPLSSLDYVLEKCDSILLMLINPGYASSKKEAQVSYGKRKIGDLHEMIQNRKLNTIIEIDGRISKLNIEEYGKELVNIFVCGTTCFDKNEISKSSHVLFEIRENVLGLNNKKA